MAEDVIKFARRSKFHRDLKRAVDGWLKGSGHTSAAPASQYVKAAVFLSVWIGTVVVMWTVSMPLWAVALLAVPCGLAMGGIGMSVMHDANHRSYSRDRRVNGALGFTLDLLGGSSYLWRVKHNEAHHTHTNIDGADDDIDLGVLGRLSPDQPWFAWHRAQHVYMWPLYGFLSIKWHWLDDWTQWRQGRIGLKDIQPIRGGSLWALLAGKVFFFGWAFVAPLLIVGVWPTLVFYFVSQFVLGFVLAVVFQLAHCVEPATFTTLERGVDLDFAQHQMATTVDFAHGNRLLTWYVGGLNYQAIHHLFPNVAHSWYPEISKIVAEVAAEHGVEYKVIPSFHAAVASHFRFLRRLAHPSSAPSITGTIEKRRLA